MKQSVTFGGVKLDPVTNTRWNFDRLRLPMQALPYGGGAVPSSPAAPMSGPGTVTCDAHIRNPSGEAFFAMRAAFEELRVPGFQRLTFRTQGVDDDTNPELWCVARMVGDPIPIPNETGIDNLLQGVRLTFEVPDPRWHSELDFTRMMRWGETWPFAGGDAIPTFNTPATWKWLEADALATSGWAKADIDGTPAWSRVFNTAGNTWTVVEWAMVSAAGETIPAWRMTNTDNTGVVIAEVKGAETAPVLDGNTVLVRAGWSCHPESGLFLRRGRSREFWTNIEYSDPRFLLLQPGTGVNNVRLSTRDGSNFDGLTLYYRHDACFI